MANSCGALVEFLFVVWMETKKLELARAGVQLQGKKIGYESHEKLTKLIGMPFHAHVKYLKITIIRFL